MKVVDDDLFRHPFGQCVVKNFAMDSARWNDFPYRSGDVVIASWARSGTTWLQQIIAQLLLGPDPTLQLDRLSPWVEQRVTPWPLVRQRLQTQSHRRFVKTHLPANALPLSTRARYLFIGRDGRDIAVSLYHFHRRHTPLAYRLLSAASSGDETKLRPPADDLEIYFDQWLDGDGYPWWPFWSHIRSWWSLRDWEQVRLVHYGKLIADYEAEVRRIAKFLEIDVPPENWSSILDLCTFESMRANSGKVFGRFAGNLLEGGMSEFFQAGKVGGWRNAISIDRSARYEERVRAELPPPCAEWLASGEVA